MFARVRQAETISGAASVAGKALGAVTAGTSQAVGLLGKALNRKQPAAPSAGGAIPITITGTTSNPNIKANVVAMFK